jgi:hypothetical protein
MTSPAVWTPASVRGACLGPYARKENSYTSFGDPSAIVCGGPKKDRDVKLPAEEDECAGPKAPSDPLREAIAVLSLMKQGIQPEDIPAMIASQRKQLEHAAAGYEGSCGTQWILDATEAKPTPQFEPQRFDRSRPLSVATRSRIVVAFPLGAASDGTPSFGTFHENNSDADYEGQVR